MSKRIASAIKQGREEELFSQLESLLLRNTIDIDAAGKGVREELVKLLDNALGKIITRLENLDQDRVFTRRRLEALKREIAGTLSKLDDKYNAVLTDARRRVIEAEYGSLAPVLAAETGKEILSRIPIKTVESLLERPLFGNRMERWVQVHLKGVEKRARQELADAVINGESIGKVNRRLRKSLGISRRNADILSRTALLKASHDARAQLYNNNRDVIKGYEYVATLDSRTCPICFPDDGKRAKKRSSLPQPPRHPRCRCIIRPLTRFSDKFPSDRPAVTKVETKVVKHRDGTTSTKFRPLEVSFDHKTYEQFFRSQPESWQRDVLGSARFRLWKDGKADLGDFRAEGRNRVLSLEQLERKIGRD